MREREGGREGEREGGREGGREGKMGIICMFNYSYNIVYLVSLYIYIYIYIQGHGEIILAQSKLNFPVPTLKLLTCTAIF